MARMRCSIFFSPLRLLPSLIDRHGYSESSTGGLAGVVFGGRARKKDFPTVFSHDPVTEGQAETGPFPHFFSREEGVEDLGLDSIRNADSRIGHAYMHPFSLGVGGESENSTGFFHGGHGVIDEIENDLLELPGVTPDPGEGVGTFSYELNLLGHEGILDDVDHGIHAMAYINGILQ